MHRLSTQSSRTVRRAAQRAANKALAVQTRGAHKEIKFSNEGRAAILKGVDVLANAVSVTLGPKGAFHVPFSVPRRRSSRLACGPRKGEVDSGCLGELGLTFERRELTCRCRS